MWRLVARTAWVIDGFTNLPYLVKSVSRLRIFFFFFFFFFLVKRWKVVAKNVSLQYPYVRLNLVVRGIKFMTKIGFWLVFFAEHCFRAEWVKHLTFCNSCVPLDKLNSDGQPGFDIERSIVIQWGAKLLKLNQSFIQKAEDASSLLAGFRVPSVQTAERKRLSLIHYAFILTMFLIVFCRLQILPWLLILGIPQEVEWKWFRVGCNPLIVALFLRRWWRFVQLWIHSARCRRRCRRVSPQTWVGIFL